MAAPRGDRLKGVSRRSIVSEAYNRIDSELGELFVDLSAALIPELFARVVETDRILTGSPARGTGFAAMFS